MFRQIEIDRSVLCVGVAAEKRIVLGGQGGPVAAAKATAADIARDASASLVAPPRTIADVTAILDQQKPDPAATAKLTATADAPVPGDLKGADLADFHYQRAQAKTLLGRTTRLRTPNSPSRMLPAADYENLGSRYEQLLMRLLRDAGQNKRANAMLAKQMAAFANQGKGKLFGLNNTLAARVHSKR